MAYPKNGFLYTFGSPFSIKISNNINSKKHQFPSKVAFPKLSKLNKQFTQSDLLI